MEFENNVTPKVSIIVPIYNVEQYIARCAISLFEQTLDSIEYIFIDDCSPDNSISVLNGIIENYPSRKTQIKIIRLSKNQGQAAVRKLGVLQATGEYIIHCDPDDWVDLDLYESLYNTAKEDDFDMVRCHFVRTDGCNETKCPELPADYYNNPLKLVSSLLQGQSMTSLCDKLFRRKLYDSIVYPVANMQEDAAMVVQLLVNCKKCKLLPKAGYHYFSNPESISKQIRIESFLSRFDDVKNNADLIFSFLNKKGLDKVFKNEIVCHKLNVRNHLLNILFSSKYYRIWSHTYPEIDKYVLINPLIQRDTKLYYILAKTRLLQIILKWKYRDNPIFQNT
jgi:glycosyltransferase involved in cell wall biosynthesis